MFIDSLANQERSSVVNDDLNGLSHSLLTSVVSRHSTLAANTTFKYVLKLFVVCMFFLGFTVSILAQTVVPDEGYTHSGGSISGIDAAWLNGLSPDSDGFKSISIDIPNAINGVNITGIGTGAFSAENTNLVAIPELRIVSINLAKAVNLKTIGDKAFYNKSGNLYSKLDVANFVLPNSISTLGESAFRGQVGLKGALVMPSSLVTLDKGYIFDGCTGFTSLDLNNVKTISSGSCIFQNCGFKTIDLKNIVTLSANYTFQGCKKLEGALVIPTTLTTWTGTYTFCQCGTEGTGITLSLPQTPLFSLITSSAFRESKLSGNLVFPEGIDSIDKSAFSETELEAVTFPKSIKKILGSAFGNTITLKEINFPSSLNHTEGLKIWNAAFQGNPVKVLIIPEYVVGLGSQTFGSQQVTTTVYFNVPQIINLKLSGSNTPFYNMNSNLVLVTPNKTVYDTWQACDDTKLKAFLTYETPITFIEPATDSPITSVPAQTKLFNKKFGYTKNLTSLEWTYNSNYLLPAVPTEYSTAMGWAFSKNGSAVKNIAEKLWGQQQIRFIRQLAQMHNLSIMEIINNHILA